MNEDKSSTPLNSNQEQPQKKEEEELSITHMKHFYESFPIADKQPMMEGEAYTEEQKEQMRRDAEIISKRGPSIKEENTLLSSPPSS